MTAPSIHMWQAGSYGQFICVSSHAREHAGDAVHTGGGNIKLVTEQQRWWRAESKKKNEKVPQLWDCLALWFITGCFSCASQSQREKEKAPLRSECHRLISTPCFLFCIYLFFTHKMILSLIILHVFCLLFMQLKHSRDPFENTGSWSGRLSSRTKNSTKVLCWSTDISNMQRHFEQQRPQFLADSTSTACLLKPTGFFPNTNYLQKNKQKRIFSPFQPVEGSSGRDRQ